MFETYQGIQAPLLGFRPPGCAFSAEPTRKEGRDSGRLNQLIDSACSARFLANPLPALPPTIRSSRQSPVAEGKRGQHNIKRAERTANLWPPVPSTKNCADDIPEYPPP